MAIALFSIKEKYANQIYLKNKRYEFRKTKPKRKIQKIIIYTTNPVKKITDEAKVKSVIEDTPENIFKMTKEFAGISKEEFFKYYKGTNKAIAYELEEVKKYEKEKTLKDININLAPQSFIYLN